MASLVCEGACNPQVPDLDRRVREKTMFCDVPVEGQVNMRSVHIPIHEAMARELRALVHTPHGYVERRWTANEASGHDVYRCGVCGHDRVWG